jgi:hypothetical protein
MKQCVDARRPAASFDWSRTFDIDVLFAPEAANYFGAGFNYPLEFRDMPDYGKFSVIGAKTGRTPCDKVPGALCHVCHKPTDHLKSKLKHTPPLPDHGRAIGRFEFSDLDTLARHCAKASETVSKWPAWKRNILRDSSKAQWDTPRLPSTEYYYTRAMSISKEIKQGKDPEGFYK